MKTYLYGLSASLDHFMTHWLAIIELISIDLLLIFQHLELERYTSSLFLETISIGHQFGNRLELVPDLKSGYFK